MESAVKTAIAEISEFTCCVSTSFIDAELSYCREVCIIVPTPTLVVMEELYTQREYFVQSILTDRYIHRKELRPVSLESPSCVEYGNKSYQITSFVSFRF